MTEHRDAATLANPPSTDELTPEQIEQVTAGEGGGAGKVNVGDLAFTHHYDAPSTRLFTN